MGLYVTAIQRRSKQDRFVFDCIIYEGSLINGLIKKKTKVTIYVYNILDSLDLIEQLENLIKTNLKLSPEVEVTILLGQKYNSYVFLQKT